MQSTPTVSVIMPVGNASDWLAETIDSIRAQTFRDWELTMVLDAPVDGSDRIAVRAANEDERISCIALPTSGGAGHARNAGLHAARGEYVIFADADDVVPPHAYETLVIRGRRTGSDIVSGSATQFDADGTTRTYWTVDEPVRKTSRDGCLVRDLPELTHDHTPWNKLIRRAWLVERGVEFPTSTTCEDLVWWARTVLDARIDLVPEEVYRHRRHDASVTARIGRGHELHDWTTQTEAAVELYRLAGLDRSVDAVGKRLLLREAWTRVRNIAAFDGDGRRELERFVLWLTTWLPIDVMNGLSPYPRACYRLLAAERADLAMAVVASFDRPGPHTLCSWSELVSEIADVLRVHPTGLSADLWRERMFDPTLGAAQRAETPQVSPVIVTAFWDDLVADAPNVLDPGEHRALEALRTGDLGDVGRIRRLRRTSAIAHARGSVEEVVLERCPDTVTGSVFSETESDRTLLATGEFGRGAGVTVRRRAPGTNLVVEVPLTLGEPLRFPVAPEAKGMNRLRAAVRRVSGAFRR